VQAVESLWIDLDGQTIPVMWNPDVVPEIYRSAVSQLSSLVLDEDFAIEGANIYRLDR
jgi:hypothetical protein